MLKKGTSKLQLHILISFLWFAVFLIVIILIQFTTKKAAFLLSSPVTVKVKDSKNFHQLNKSTSNLKMYNAMEVYIHKALEMCDISSKNLIKRFYLAGAGHSDDGSTTFLRRRKAKLRVHILEKGLSSGKGNRV